MLDGTYHVTSLFPLPVEPHKPCPGAPTHMIQLTQEQHAQPYSMCTFTSADTDPLTMPSPPSACQLSVLAYYLTLSPSQVTPQSLGMDRCDE